LDEDISKEFTTALNDGVRVDKLRRRIVEGLIELQKIQIKSIAQGQVVASLLEGRKTIAELVEAIYGVKPDSPDYHSGYMKISRALQDLEARGYVSRALLGRDKPYRLTRYALEAFLTMQDKVTLPRALVSRLDMIFYIISIMLVAGSLLRGTGLLELSRQWSLTLYGSLLFTLGASFSRIIDTFRRVL
jgi:hypothetical protein